MTLTVTTSWDDGHVLDMRLSGLLDRYGLPATFYIAPRSTELEPSSRLDDHQIRELAKRFEIGGHTLTHRPLTSLPPKEAEAEIGQGKAYLEDITQVRLTSFCYPRGVYAGTHVKMVEKAGFSYARTTRRYVTKPPTDPLQAGTTVHAYRHLMDWRGFYRRLLATRRIRATAVSLLKWDELAVRLFDELLESQTLTCQNIFHLWGHSWEIEANDDWKRLEHVFDHISERVDVDYRSNSSCGVSK